MLRFYLAVAVYLALISTNSWTQEKAQPELLVAAAADLNPALHDIAQHYEKKTGIRIKLSSERPEGSLSKLKMEPPSICFSRRIWIIPST